MAPMQVALHSNSCILNFLGGLAVSPKLTVRLSSPFQHYSAVLSTTPTQRVILLQFQGILVSWNVNGME